MLMRLARTPLALMNLLHQKARTATAVAGVTFACILLFMQLGLYTAVEFTATMLFDRLDFDVVLLSRDYLDLNRCRSFPRIRLAQALAEGGVSSATPLYIGANLWQNPQYDPVHQRNLMLLGVRPERSVFRDPQPVDPNYPQEYEAGWQELRRIGAVMIDRHNWPEYGPQQPGTVANLGATQVEIVGRFSVGTGFGYNALAVTSDQTFSRSFGGSSLDNVNLGLIKLTPGADPNEVADRLSQRLPSDVQVLTRQQLEDREKQYWMKNTSIGMLFSFGVVVSLIVGTVFVYQVISSDITNRLKEFATLKAIGYPGRYLTKVVLYQSLLLAALGYLPGLAVSTVLFRMTERYGGVPTRMSFLIAAVVLGLTVSMCTISAVLALRKAHAADPADLF
ncbi:MAG TPA: ABC transporter permease DevC [Gemmataceae bacterium]|nr:ABC transporter permease DevC [Gemmataceae bacterium]